MKDLKDTTALQTICLYAIESNYDKTAHIVVLTRETDTDFWGYPLNNHKCPVLQWPKFAWKMS
jgi:hypothetical protein